MNHSIHSNGKKTKAGISVHSAKLTFILLCIFIGLASPTHEKQEEPIISCPEFFSEVPFDSYDTKDQVMRSKIVEKAESGRRFSSDCPAELSKLGMFSSAEYLIETQILPEKSDIENSFKLSSNYITSRLENLHKLMLNAGKKITISPAIKWGQSLEDLLIFVKFAPRIDSPGCNELLEKEVFISESNELRLEAFGILSGAPVRFSLTVPLFDRVIRQGIEVKNAGVGALIIEVKKVKNNVWVQLFQERFDASGVKSTVWWDLSGGKYSEGMRVFREMHKKMDQRDAEGIWNSKPRRGGDGGDGFFSRAISSVKEWARWAFEKLRGVGW